MKILAFETSCDDTSIALFEDDVLLSMYTASQLAVHNITQGVVPEVAAREHANNIFDVLDIVLKQGLSSLQEIDYIAVTTTPGLLTSLLTGISVARTISVIYKIPIIPVHHIEAHIFSNYLEREESAIVYPFVCLTVSGGHNDMYYMSDMWSMEKIGSSSDDAGGEAFDKVAKMMGLGYPGGPIISKLSGEYEEKGGISKEIFPRVWLKKQEFDFSFSGLKTAVKREIDNRVALKGSLDIDDQREIAYEFEKSVVEVMAYKLINAAKIKKVPTVLLSGGVSANKRLRDTIANMAYLEGFRFLYPKKGVYCMDNAAMVGVNAYYKIKYTSNEFSLSDFSF